jgi:hypothetical protein
MKPPYPKITFRVSQSLHESLLAISRQQGISLSRLIKSTLNNYVGQNQKDSYQCHAQTAPSQQEDAT